MAKRGRTKSSITLSDRNCGIGWVKTTIRMRISRFPSVNLQKLSPESQFRSKCDKKKSLLRLSLWFYTFATFIVIVQLLFLREGNPSFCGSAWDFYLFPLFLRVFGRFFLPLAEGLKDRGCWTVQAVKSTETIVTVTLGHANKTELNNFQRWWKTSWGSDPDECESGNEIRHSRTFDPNDWWHFKSVFCATGWQTHLSSPDTGNKHTLWDEELTRWQCLITAATSSWLSSFFDMSSTCCSTSGRCDGLRSLTPARDSLGEVKSWKAWPLSLSEELEQTGVRRILRNYYLM